MINKAIIFDASTLISFAMNGLYGELKKLREIFQGKFLITEEVRKEVIEKPLNIKKFKLEAMRLRKLLNKKVLELPDSIGIEEDEISNMTRDILEIANKSFSANGKELHIIDSGEASCLALSKILWEQDVENVVAVDERTIRMLAERPQNLDELLSRKLHTSVKVNRKNFQMFKEFGFIRSSELVYVAHKKGLVDLEGNEVLDALLYAMKSKGCGISDEEIKEIKKLR